jgi:hypothetical protein
MLWWIAKGFGGMVAPGNVLPTYCAITTCSTTGQNVALAFYCDNTAMANTCPANSPANTYFFSKDKLGANNVCQDDPFGAQYGVGCRDVAVPIWDMPDRLKGGIWDNTGSFAPDRVRISRVLNFRIYCDHQVPNDPSTLCTNAPKFVGSSSNSRVYGMFVSPLISGPCTSNCAPGPTINGNYASLDS